MKIKEFNKLKEGDIVYLYNNASLNNFPSERFKILLITNTAGGRKIWVSRDKQQSAQHSYLFNLSDFEYIYTSFVEAELKREKELMRLLKELRSNPKFVMQP